MSTKEEFEKIESEIVFQQSREKEFSQLTDREKYHRAQKRVEQREKQLENVKKDADRNEIQHKIEALKVARDQWKDSR